MPRFFYENENKLLINELLVKFWFKLCILATNNKNKNFYLKEKCL